jgi:ribosomal protein L37AE/L43A
MVQELITISRGGVEMGKFLEGDLLGLIEQKKVLPTDHYWKTGMVEWRSVAELIPALKAAQELEAAEKARLKREADAHQAELAAWATAEAQRRAAKLTFRCHCCKVEFAKPFDPESEIGDGVIDVFIGSFLVLIPIIGWLFVPFFILRGFAKVVASRVKSPHCPNCRSTNISREEGSDKPLFQ